LSCKKGSKKAVQKSEKIKLLNRKKEIKLCK
jgi:hypothetical protein